MGRSRKEAMSSESNIHLLLAYVADLELEVDRLRKHSQFIHHQVKETLKRIHHVSTNKETDNTTDALAEIANATEQLAAVLRDLQESQGYHPAHDQVIAIAVRPLVEQVFRWQQRLLGALDVVLRLELESEYIEWFPSRLRHILDNLISNALRYRDPDKDAEWVSLGLRVSPESYELRVSDNGVGLSAGGRAEVFELFYRAAPARAAGLGVGLAVAKVLVEQSNGTLTVDSGAGQGTTFVAVLPRYDVDDFLL